jgi:tetratricopeptide (TPR) repeat protein
MNRGKLRQRVRELAAQGQYDDAWLAIEPLTADVAEDIDLARLWTALAVFSPAPDDGMAKTAVEIISRYPGERSLVAMAASILVLVAETRPFDEAPLANGPARLAADTLAGLIESLSAEERDDPAVAADLYSELAMALRLTGSQDDETALEAMNHALQLDPANGSSWFRLGLLHKWRGRWRAGIEANRRARELGETEGVLWNLAICAMGAGDHALAADVMQELGMKGTVGVDGIFTGTFDGAQVRVSTLGEGVDPAAHIVGAEPGFENLWIERLSYVHGRIANASIYDLPVDYGDIVLFDGAAVGWRDDGTTRTPRFPLLQKLRTGAFRRYRFVARQPHGGFLVDLNRSLPAETFFYVHDEQVNMLCADCARGGKIVHDHSEPESFLVSGKFVVPEACLDFALVETLENLAADTALIAIPQLFRDLGDAARARRDEERWRVIDQAREDAKHQVICDVHGATAPAYVCQHLVTGKGLGFVAAEASETERPDAWCSACEKVRLAEGSEWNERSEAFAGITLICARCYDQARERNESGAKKSRLLFWKK